MALTYSEMIPLDSKAKPFSLRGTDGKTYSLEQFKNAQAFVIIFLCNHCPYVKAVEDRIGKLASEFQSRNVQFLGICSNDQNDYPEDSTENLVAQAARAGFAFPYLIDETQEVAKNYGAVCTPDFFVFDSAKKLQYRGRLDDSWKDAAKVTSEDLKKALEAIVAGNPVSKNQLPAMGCSIKWSK